jgi:hypothetical protein
MWSELVLTPWHNNSRICTVPNNCKKTKSQKEIKIKFSINVLAVASASWIICIKSSKFLIIKFVQCQPLKHEKHRSLSVIRVHGAALVVSVADVHVRPHWPLFLPHRRRGPSSWIQVVLFCRWEVDVGPFFSCITSCCWRRSSPINQVLLKRRQIMMYSFFASCGGQYVVRRPVGAANFFWARSVWWKFIKERCAAGGAALHPSTKYSLNGAKSWCILSSHHVGASTWSVAQ